MTPSFMIIIHDVAAPFCRELDVISRQLHALVDSRFSCAVVPRWHGEEIKSNVLPDVVATCREVLLHGWTHRRDHQQGIVSLLTNRSDEFGGLTAEQIQTRVDVAKEELVNLTGREIRGLVPPAWQLPMPTANLSGLSYVVRHGTLESCESADANQRLATWSFDWGWVRGVTWAGIALGNARRRFCADTIPCIVIHPVDVARGWLPRIVRLIESFLELGLQPFSPHEIYQLLREASLVESGVNADA